MLARTLATVLVLPLLAGCDGSLSVHGTAYRYVKAPPDANSAIVIDKPWEPAIALVPLEGVKVTLYHSEDYVTRTDETAKLWRSTAVSVADGSFETGGATAPGKRKRAIGAERQGCKSALTTFVDEGSGTPHTVTVVLVCSDLP